MTGLFLSLAIPVHAQEFRGTLSGNVTDTSGAVVPNASVVATEVNTGTVKPHASRRGGRVGVPFLLPGTYTVQAKAAGFEGVV